MTLALTPAVQIPIPSICVCPALPLWSPHQTHLWEYFQSLGVNWEFSHFYLWQEWQVTSLCDAKPGHSEWTEFKYDIYLCLMTFQIVFIVPSTIE